MSQKTVLVTGASSGFGRLIADALARAGHMVYASMRDIGGRNASTAAEMRQAARQSGGELRVIELDVQSEPSVESAVSGIIGDTGRIGVMIHNAGHMMFGPAEAFTPEQFAQQYDVNVLGTQRVNRAVLPHMRRRDEGLLLWISSSSSAGGTPPYLSPYFAAKAAMDALAGPVCPRAQPLGHRDHDHRAGRLHPGHQPLHPCRRAGRCAAARGV